MRAFPDRKSLVAILLVGFYLYLIFFHDLGSHPLIDSDEPRYAQAALEMVESGRYLVPVLNGEPRINKPPLLYWTIALLYRVIGVSETAARLPSACAGLLSVFFTWAFTRRLFNAKAAFLSVIVLSSMPLFAAVSHLAITDSMLTAFLTGAIYFWWRSAQAQRQQRGWGILSMVFLAMACLSKGPVAVVLMGLLVTLWCAIGGDFRFARVLLDPIALAVFFVIVLPWPISVAIELEGAVGIWWRETATRYVHGVDHASFFGASFIALAAGTMPWWPALLPPAGRIAGLPGLLRADATVRLLFVWAGVVVVFFTLSRTQLATYVLPGTVPVAIAVAGMLSRSFTDHCRRARPVVNVFAAAVVALVLIGAYAVSHNAAGRGVLAFGGAGLLGTAAVLVVLLRGRRYAGACKVLVSLVALWTVFIFPTALEAVAQRRSLKGLAEGSAGDLAAAERLFFVGKIRNSLTFYAGLRNYEAIDFKDVEPLLSGSARVALFMRASVADRLIARGDPALRVAGRHSLGRREYVLLVNFPARPIAE